MELAGIIHDPALPDQSDRVAARVLSRRRVVADG
jgi:hypothetical protein